MANVNIGSQMEAEVYKRKLERLQQEREKIHEKMIKDSEAAFKGALLSNLKALEKMNKNLGGIGGAMSNKGSSSSKALATNHAKTIAKNTDMMVKHAVSQVSLLKSIDKSLLNIATLLKPQFKVFERSIDSLIVKVLDKQPVRVYQDMNDPRRSGFKKALDTIFGAQAPAQEVYVQNWKEIKEGQSRTRSDLVGRIGQMLSGGLIGKFTGLGGAFRRGVYRENDAQQFTRILTEARHGGDVKKIMSREASVAKMSEVEKIFSGARGGSVSLNSSSVFALFSEEGRKNLVKLLTESFTDAYNISIEQMETSRGRGATGKVGSFDSKVREEFNALRKAAQLQTDFSKATFKKTTTATELIENMWSINVGNIKAPSFKGYAFKKPSFDGLKGYAFKKPSFDGLKGGGESLKEMTKQFSETVQKVSTKSSDLLNTVKIKTMASEFASTSFEKAQQLKQTASGVLDTTEDAIKKGFDSVKEMFSGMSSITKSKTFSKSLFAIVKLERNIGKIRKNTDEIVKILQMGTKGTGKGTGKGTSEERKGLLGWIGRRWKNRESFKLTNKMGTFQQLAGLGMKGAVTFAKIKTMPYLVGAKIASTLLGRFGKGSFQLSGIGGGGLKTAGKVGIGLGKKTLGAAGSFARSLFGGDSFRLRGSRDKMERSKEKLEDRRTQRGGIFGKLFNRGKNDVVLKIYKLLLKRLPKKRAWSMLGGAGGGNAISNMVGNAIKNPIIGLGIAATASVTAAVKSVKGVIDERKAHAKTIADQDAQSKGLDERTKKKYGISFSDLQERNNMRTRIGKSKINFKTVEKLKEMGYDINTVPPDVLDRVQKELDSAKTKSVTPVSVKPKSSITVGDMSSSLGPATAKNASGATVIQSTPKILGNQQIVTNDQRMEKMMKFLIGEFTNNLVMSLSKNGKASGNTNTKVASSPGLNVFK